MQEVKVCELCEAPLPKDYELEICRKCLSGFKTTTNDITGEEEFEDEEVWDIEVDFDEDLTFLQDQDPGDEH